jgi:hypothetical protein
VKNMLFGGITRLVARTIIEVFKLVIAPEKKR